MAEQKSPKELKRDAFLAKADKLTIELHNEQFEKGLTKINLEDQVGKVSITHNWKHNVTVRRITAIEKQEDSAGKLKVVMAVDFFTLDRERDIAMTFFSEIGQRVTKHTGFELANYLEEFSRQEIPELENWYEISNTLRSQVVTSAWIKEND